MATELKRERLTKFINAAVTPSEKDALTAYCEKNEVKQSEVLRYAVTLFLEMNSRKSKESDEKSTDALLEMEPVP